MLSGSKRLALGYNLRCFRNALGDRNGLGGGRTRSIIIIGGAIIIVVIVVIVVAVVRGTLEDFQRSRWATALALVGRPLEDFNSFNLLRRSLSDLHSGFWVRIDSSFTASSWW